MSSRRPEPWKSLSVYLTHYYFARFYGFTTYFSHGWFVKTNSQQWSCHLLLIWKMYDVIHGIIVILDHQSIGVDIPLSVSSYSLQEIWCKIHNSVMVESKMATMRCFCNGSISEKSSGNVQFERVNYSPRICSQSPRLHKKKVILIFFWHDSITLPAEEIGQYFLFLFCFIVNTNKWLALWAQEKTWDHIIDILWK